MERPPHWRHLNRTKHLLSGNVDPLASAGATAFWLQKFEANVARVARAMATLTTMGFAVAVVWKCETLQRARVRGDGAAGEPRPRISAAGRHARMVLRASAMPSGRPRWSVSY